MAGPYDFEALYGVDPEIAARLRSKYAPEGQAMDMATPAEAPPAPGGAVVGRSAPVPVEQQDPFSRWVSQSVIPGIKQAFSSSDPLVQIPTATPPNDTPKPREPVSFQRTTGEAPPPQPEDAAPAEAQAPAYGGGGSGLVVLPGGMRPSTSETTMTRTGDPEEVERIRRAQDSAAGYGVQSASAARDAADINIRADLEEAERRRVAAARYEDMLRNNAIEREQYVKEQRARFDAMSADLAKDPTTQYWASKSDGEKVLSFVGVILSGIGSGMTGGPNLALQKIDTEINRGIANKREAFGRARSLYQEMLQEYGDRATAINAAKAAAYDKVAQELAPMRALAKSKDAEARYAQIVQGVEQKRADAAAEVEKSLGLKYEQKDAQKYQAPQVLGGGANDKPIQNTATLSDGTTVQFQNSEQGNKAVERIQGYTKVQELYNRATELRKKLAAATPGTSTHEAIYRNLEKIAGDIIYEESMARGQGIVKKDEMEEGKKTSPVLAGLGERGAVAGNVANTVNPWLSRDREAGEKGIALALKQAEVEQRALVQAAGGRIVQRGYAQTPTGELTPTGRYTGQDLSPAQRLAPSGFKPLDNRKDVTTAARALAETTPKAPILRKGQR